MSVGALPMLSDAAPVPSPMVKRPLTTCVVPLPMMIESLMAVLSEGGNVRPSENTRPPSGAHHPDG
jgi:hypothetical protein